MKGEIVLETLTEALQEDADIQSIVSGIRSGMKEQILSGLSGSARQVMLATLYKQIDKPIIMVTHNLYSAQKIAEDLLECLPKEEVLTFPVNEITLTETAAASPEILAQRIEVLTKCANGFRGIVVVPYAGIRKIIPPAQLFQGASISIKPGDIHDLASLLERLAALGYDRVERVEGKGEMSVRGGIVDVYPLHVEHAYRIEWFDDEIDSIRTFNAEDQRSIEQVNEVIITPCREFIAEQERLDRAAQQAYEFLQTQLERMTDRKTKEHLTSYISRHIEQLREGIYFQEIVHYAALIYPERHTLLDYFGQDAVLVMDEPIRLIETAKQLEHLEAEGLTSLLAEGKSLPALVLSKSYESLFQIKPFPTLYLSLFLRQIPHTQPQNIVNIACRPMQNFHGQMNVLKSEIGRWRKAGYDVLLLANGEDRISRLRRILHDFQIDEPRIIDGHLQTGFELSAIQLVVITEGELFTQKKRRVRKGPSKIDNAERIRSYTELNVGDYVVHINHGVGRYEGIGTLEINGIHKDYLHIVYAGGDKLSVPIEQIDMVQKYVGAEDKEPKLYKLGGNEWTRVKSRARSSVQDIADELVKLYAERQATKGYAFEPDSPYQSEFEAQFEYEETADQLRAIVEIKRDMEKPQPMDRLLCGDVGYGKTEVAIRAAFKAAMEGKQVAVLVPTTILAQQHYETFTERFADYPVNIQVLSRFRSKKEQTETIKGVRNGTVDIIIGTHRLLSVDVKFQALGLLVVDEEQRFGVSHKEKIKKLKTNVDVLTLTATPIPRTLHMSMIGVRDLSVIETPPENRFPVQTYVLEYNPTLVRETIERELARGGQVYFLFNRVQGIYQMAEQISALVPDARVVVSHGRMPEQELEKTILDFLDGEYDVLVSTTIIETGVDIPNVNTLIVYDADKMGLSQLYQLRGRVGRSNRIAYAYFTYQRDKVLTEVAEKRLQSIKEFTELGSGFKIAMRDLSIRGAGNLLGAEQHGFIASVGFEMYSQMLAEEMTKRKAELGNEAVQEEEPVKTQLDINVDAYIPSEYITDSMQKIEIYKKVAAVSAIEEAEDLIDELLDRFGDPPQPVINLLSVAKLKVYGQVYGIESITEEKDDLVIRMRQEQNDKINGPKLVAISMKYDGRVKMSVGTNIKLTVRRKGLDDQQALELLENFLIQYKEAVKAEGELQHVGS